MRLTEERVVARLKQGGHKLTPQRRAVVRAIVSGQDHLSPVAIFSKLHQDYPNIGLVTIYRTLEILARLGLICEVHAGGSCHSYTISALEQHNHLICSGCGMVVDFSGYNLGELEKRLSLETGFAIEGHLLEFLGRCQDCQKEVAI